MYIDINCLLRRMLPLIHVELYYSSPQGFAEVIGRCIAVQGGGILRHIQIR